MQILALVPATVRKQKNVGQRLEGGYVSQQVCDHLMVPRLGENLINFNQENGHLSHQCFCTAYRWGFQLELWENRGLPWMSQRKASNHANTE